MSERKKESDEKSIRKGDRGGVDQGAQERTENLHTKDKTENLHTRDKTENLHTRDKARESAHQGQDRESAHQGQGPRRLQGEASGRSRQPARVSLSESRR